MEQLPPELLRLCQRLEERVKALEERRERLSCTATPTKGSNRGRKPEEVHNPFVGLAALLRSNELLVKAYGYPAWLDDVLQGVARADWYRPTARSIPLSVRRMLLILDRLPIITAAQVSSLLLIERRQAQRYVQALRTAMPHLLAGMPAGTLEDIAAAQADTDLFDDEEGPTGVAA